MTRRRPLGALLASAALALLLSACTAGAPSDPIAQATDAPAAAEPTPTPSATPTPTPTPEAPQIVAVDPTEYDLADSPTLAYSEPRARRFVRVRLALGQPALRDPST